jgi:primosomal protein N'
VDEEHDPSFKQQEPAPRYHASDAAIYYASLFNAKVILGSATPSLESYFNCRHGKYGLVNLAERYGNVKMPVIELVDTKRIITKDKQGSLFRHNWKRRSMNHSPNKNRSFFFKTGVATALTKFALPAAGYPNASIAM